MVVESSVFTSRMEEAEAGGSKANDHGGYGSTSRMEEAEDRGSEATGHGGYGSSSDGEEVGKLGGSSEGEVGVRKAITLPPSCASPTPLLMNWAPFYPSIIASHSPSPLSASALSPAPSPLSTRPSPSSLSAWLSGWSSTTGVLMVGERQTDMMAEVQKRNWELEEEKNMYERSSDGYGDGDEAKIVRGKLLGNSSTNSGNGEGGFLPSLLLPNPD